MYTLYYLPGACSSAVHAVLCELGQQVDLKNVTVAPGQPRPPEFLRVNPRGQVPTLVDEGIVIREGAAILLHLLEKHESPLLPKTGKQRASALEWLMFCNATLHPAYGRIFGAMRELSGETQAQVLEAAFQRVNALWADVERHLEHTEYLAGSECTVADILLAVIANWSARFEGKITLGPKTRASLAKVVKRPAFQQMLQAEDVTYKIAA
jgi:glutathione S-transferase